jgi:hypothetical protein
MSKLGRALTLAAMLAAMSLTGTTAVAQTHANDDATSRPDAQQQVTSQQQPTRDATRAALAQERYYSTWAYGDASTPAPAHPGRRPAWLAIGLSVLAAVTALVGGVAVLAAHRATGGQRAGQTA